MGSVYRARHLATDRDVALKTLYFSSVPPDRREVFRTRFRRESLLVLSLEHPHLVRGYDALVENESGYIAMEFVEGPSVEHLIEKDGRGLPTTPVLVILTQLAQALDHLERRGIVHRDIKPANVIIGRGGVCKLCDFGLSRKSDLLGARVTVPNVPLGTIDTMPPEQVRGGQNADGRSDLYSFGATAFWMLTGRPPFVCDNPYEVLARILDTPAPSVCSVREDLDPRLVEVVDTLLQKKPEDRLQNASQVLSMLAPLLAEAGAADPLRARELLADFAGVRSPATRGGLSSERLPVVKSTPDPASDEGRGAAPALDAAPGDDEVVVVLRGRDTRASRGLLRGEHFYIGRSSDAHVCVRDSWISRKHTRIEHSASGIVVEDLGSANGTFVNERRIQKAVIRDGDRLRCGRIAFEVEVRAATRDGSTTTHDVELRCESCQNVIPLAIFADGEVIQLDRGFLCPSCAESRKAAAFDLERRAIDAIFQSGYEVLERVEGSSAVPAWKAFERDASASGNPGDVEASAELGPGLMHRVVAVRVVVARDEQAAAALADAAASASHLDHANVLHVHKVAVVDDLVLVVTDHVEAETLEDRIARRGPLSLRDVVAVGLGAARALEVAETGGVIHGGLAPNAVILGPGCAPRIADFALESGPPGGGPHRLPPLEAKKDGDPCHAAPELLEGRPPDRRSDLYGWGAVVFQALTGEAPASLRVHHEESGRRRHVAIPATPLDERHDLDVPFELRALVKRCLERDPEARPTGFAEIAAGLVRLERRIRLDEQPTSDDMTTSFGDVNKHATPSTDASGRTLSMKAVDYAGWIRENELLDFAKYVGARRRTGLLTVISRGQRTKLAIREGVVLEVDGGEGGDASASAIAALASTDGAFRFRQEAPGDPPSAEPVGVLLQLVGEAQRRRG